MPTKKLQSPPKTVRIEFIFPDSFHFKLPQSPIKYFGKTIFSAFLKLNGFWIDKEDLKITITDYATLRVVFWNIVKEKGDKLKVNLPKTKSDLAHFKEIISEHDMWMFSLLFKGKVLSNTKDDEGEIFKPPSETQVYRIRDIPEEDEEE